MKEFRILKIIDIFKGLFEKMDIDYDVMRSILQLKLLLDTRRVPTIMKNNANAKKKKETEDKNEGNKFILSLWFYVLMGFITVPLVLIGENYFFQMSLIFGILFFMIMSTLIADFSTVLLDVRDKNILLIRPVNKETINMAKMLHILIYMFYITMATAGLPLIASLFRHGLIFFLVFLIEVIWLDLFLVVLAALFYLAILKVFDGEKLKDIINFSQIALTMGVTIGYQFTSRIFVFAESSAQVAPRWWQYLIIPSWFAGPYEVILHGNLNAHYIAFSVLAFTIPLFLIVLYIKLMPTFERSLQKLSAISSKIKPDRMSISKMLGKFVTKNQEELLMYNFSLEMFKSEREFKLKTYPSIGMAIVIPLIFVFNVFRDMSLVEIRNSKAYFIIYLCALILPTLIMMVPYSEKFKGAFIYYILPINKAENLHMGAIKAMLIKYVFPIYLFECIVFTAFFGPRIILDLIIVLLSVLLYLSLTYYFSEKKLPFSEAYGLGNQSGSGSKTLIFMFILSIIGGVHFAISFFSPIKIPFAIALFFSVWLAWKALGKKINKELTL